MKLLPAFVVLMLVGCSSQPEPVVSSDTFPQAERSALQRGAGLKIEATGAYWTAVRDGQLLIERTKWIVIATVHDASEAHRAVAASGVAYLRAHAAHFNDLPGFLVPTPRVQIVVFNATLDQLRQIAESPAVWSIIHLDE